MNRLGTRPVGYGYKSNHPVACGAAGWNEKEYMENEESVLTDDVIGVLGHEEFLIGGNNGHCYLAVGGGDD